MRARSVILLLAGVAGVAGIARGEPRAALTLSQAFELAQARSEVLSIAQIAVDDAQARHRGTWTVYGPSIALNATGVVQNEITLTNTDSTGKTTTEVFQAGEAVVAGAAVNQPVFRRGIWPAREAGRLGVESARATMTRSREQLMMDVTTAFIAVLRARQQVVLATSAQKRAELQLQGVSARVKAGGGLRSAELLAQLEVQRAQVLVSNAAGALSLEEAHFERLVGIAPPPSLALPPTPTLPSPAESLDAAGRRADVRAIETAAWQSRANEGTLRAKLWPTFDLGASFTYYYPTFLAPYIWQLKGILNIPLLQGGDEYEQIRLQKIRSQRLLLDKLHLEREIGEEVKRARVRVDTAERAIELARLQGQTAQQHYDLVVNQFRLGAATALEVANAQAGLTEAENLAVVAGYDRELAAYQVLFAAGLLKL